MTSVPHPGCFTSTTTFFTVLCIRCTLQTSLSIKFAVCCSSLSFDFFFFSPCSQNIAFLPHKYSDRLPRCCNDHVIRTWVSPAAHIEFLSCFATFSPPIWHCVASLFVFVSGRWRWRRWSRRRCSCLWSEFPARSPLQANRCKSTAQPQSVYWFLL